MRNITALLLSIFVLFSLAACSAKQTEPTTVQTQEATEPQQVQELVELDISDLGMVYITGIDSNTQYTVINYTDYTEAGDSEEYDSEPVQEYLAVYDLAKNELVRKVIFPNENGCWYTVSINDNGFNLINQQMGEIIGYNFDLEHTSDATYEFSETWEKTEIISAIDAFRFDCKDLYALSSTYVGQARALLFYDQPDMCYMLKIEPCFEYRQCFDHTVLIVDNTANQTQEHPESVIRVRDFDAFTQINQLTIPNTQIYNNVQTTNLNATTASITTCSEAGSTEKVYVWQYTRQAENAALEAPHCDRFSVNELDGRFNELSARIEQQYGITLECAPDRQFIRDDYNYTNDLPPILFYQYALDLEYYLSLLPEGVYSEILCRNIDAPLTTFDEFRLFLVGDFPDEDVAAYASNISSEETDEKSTVYIVYSCTNLNERNFFHELMHTFEYRIWNYEENFDIQWSALNPTGFEYTDNYALCFYDDNHEDWQSYFTRDYGMKSMLEDRATCFEELCDGVLCDNMWWREEPMLAAKEQYLIEVLQKSFPSLSEWDIFERAFSENLKTAVVF